MSLHADALATLTAWEAPDADQAGLQQRYTEHLREHSDGLQRACFPAHVTAGCLVLSPDAVLLNLHRKAGRWFAFGGHCEPGDRTLAGAALREAVEESGLAEGALRMHPEPVHLDEHVVDFCDPRGPVHHLDVRYAALADPADSHGPSEESIDVRWWPLEDLPEGLERDMHTLIRHARARLLG